MARLRGILEQLVGLAQVLERQRGVGVRAGDAEVEQDLPAPLRRRWLLERAGEIGHRAVGRAAPHRRLGRLHQQVHDPFLRAPRHREQVRGHLIGLCAGFTQHRGGTRVHQLALSRRQLLVDGLAHQRMHESERRSGTQDLRAREAPARVGHLLLGQLGQLGHGRQVGALAEHGNGPGHAHGLVREAREPQQHGARHGARPDVRHHVHVRGVGLHAVRLERAEQLAQQQRVPAGHACARGAEALVGLGAEPRPHQLGDRGAAQGAGVDRVGDRVVLDLGDQRGIGSRVRAPQRRADQRRHVLEPADEVGEVAKRGAVAPVQVVHRQQQRPVGRHVRRQPVEAVQRREGRIGRQRRPPASPRPRRSRAPAPPRPPASARAPRRP